MSQPVLIGHSALERLGGTGGSREGYHCQLDRGGCGNRFSQRTYREDESTHKIGSDNPCIRACTTKSYGEKRLKIRPTFRFIIPVTQCGRGTQCLRSKDCPIETILALRRSLPPSQPPLSQLPPSQPKTSPSQPKTSPSQPLPSLPSLPSLPHRPMISLEIYRISSMMSPAVACKRHLLSVSDARDCCVVVVSV